MSKFKSLFVLFCSVALSFAVNAGLVNYQIDAFGRIISSDNGVNYFNGYDNGRAGPHWEFNTNNNTFGSSLAGFGRTLQTNKFTVADVLDVTWTHNDRAWLETTKGYFQINHYGQVISDDIGARYFNGFSGARADSFWVFNRNNHTYGRNISGTSNTLFTNEFSVADVLDITWTQNEIAWVETTRGYFQINAFGQVLSRDQGVNYFNASNGGYWAFDTNNNTFGNSQYGLGRSLQTNEFTVADIVDVTWTQNDRAWVQVRTAEAPNAEVPTPHTLPLFVLSILGLYLGRIKTKAL